MSRQLNKQMLPKSVTVFLTILCGIFLYLTLGMSEALARQGQTSISQVLNIEGVYSWDLDQTGNAHPDSIPIGAISKVDFPIAVKRMVKISGEVEISVDPPPSVENDAYLEKIEIFFQRLDTQEILPGIWEVPIPEEKEKVCTGTTVDYPLPEISFDISNWNLQADKTLDLKGFVRVRMNQKLSPTQKDIYEHQQSFTVTGGASAELQAVGLSNDDGLELSDIKVDEKAVSRDGPWKFIKPVTGGEKLTVYVDAKGLNEGDFRVSSDVRLVAPNSNSSILDSDFDTVWINVYDPKAKIEIKDFTISGQREGWSLEHFGSPQSQTLKVGEKGTVIFDVYVKPFNSVVFNGSVGVEITGDTGRAVKELEITLKDPTSGETVGSYVYRNPQASTSNQYDFSFRVESLELDQVEATAKVTLESDNNDDAIEAVEVEIPARSLDGSLLSLPSGLKFLKVNGQEITGDYLTTISGEQVRESRIFRVTAEVEGLVPTPAETPYLVRHKAELNGLSPNIKAVQVLVTQEVHNPTPSKVIIKDFTISGQREGWTLEQFGSPQTQTLKVGEKGTVIFDVYVKPFNSVIFNGSVGVEITGDTGRAVKELEITLKDSARGETVGSYVYRNPQASTSNQYDFSFRVESLELDQVEATAKVTLESDDNDDAAQALEVEITARSLDGSLLPLPSGLRLLKVNGQAITGDSLATISGEQVRESRIFRVTAEVEGLVPQGSAYNVGHTAILTKLEPDTKVVQIKVVAENQDGGDTPGGDDNPGGGDTPDGGDDPGTINPPGDTHEPTIPSIEDPKPQKPELQLPKKDGGVTPPPSESVTPPKVKITPERVPAGDPTITVKSIEELKAAYAILPEGRRLDLKYNSKTGVWKNSFLVPFGTADGPYSIKIYTINRQNSIRQYYYTITIDNSLPLIILNPIKDNDKLKLSAQVLFPAAKVTAQLGTINFALVKEQGSDKWFGTWSIPSDLNAGTYDVTVLAVDKEGHSGKATFVLKVEKDSKAKATTFTGVNIAEEKTPEVKVEATEAEKRSIGITFTWGIPLAGILTVGLLKRRRK